jgi:hypothetical protein
MTADNQVLFLLKTQYALENKTLLNSPEKFISALGYTICPFSGKNTNGIFCVVVPAKNGAR